MCASYSKLESCFEPREFEIMEESKMNVAFCSKGLNAENVLGFGTSIGGSDLPNVPLRPMSKEIYDKNLNSHSEGKC